MRRNLLANYVGTAFSAAAQVLVIPLYVHLLGEKNWGLLATIMALSGALLAFEAGVSLSVARRFVGLYTLDDPVGKFKSLEARYFAAGACLLIVGMVVSVPLGAWGWHGGGSAAFAWAFAMAAAQIMGSLYRSILVGTGDQVALNALLIAFTVLRHGAAMAAAFGAGTVTSVVCAMACMLTLEALLRRRRTLRSLGLLPASDVPNASLDQARSGSSSTQALVVAGAIGAVSTQVDRLTLTGFINAAVLGHYAIAASLSLAALQLVYPVSAALIPRLGQFQSGAKHSRTLARTYALLFAILAAVWVGAATLSVAGLELWLRSASIADAVRPLFLSHLAGTTLNALCIPNYMQLLSDHRDKAIAGAAVAGLAAQLACIGLLGSSQSAMAGSLSWIAGNAVLFLTYHFLQLKRRADDGTDAA